jgi:hypothetical protein
MPQYEVHILFSLQLEVQLLSMAELEDVHVAIPTGMLERNRGVKTRDSQLQDRPEKIISIPGLHPNGQNFGLDFGVRGGDQVGENLHHGHRTLTYG